MYTINVYEIIGDWCGEVCYDQQTNYIGIFGTFQTLEEAKTVLNGIAARVTAMPYKMWINTTVMRLFSSNGKVLKYEILQIKSFGELPIPSTLAAENMDYHQQLKELRAQEKQLRAKLEELRRGLDTREYLGVHRDNAFRELESLGRELDVVCRRIKRIWPKLKH